MAKSLVIVESPAKAKTIGKYLGNQYIVKASLGHIKDLPRKISQSMWTPTSSRLPGHRRQEEAHHRAEAGGEEGRVHLPRG